MISILLLSFQKVYTKKYENSSKNKIKLSHTLKIASPYISSSDYKLCVRNEVTEIVNNASFDDIINILENSTECIISGLNDLYLVTIKECGEFAKKNIDEDIINIGNIINTANENAKGAIQPVLDNLNDQIELLVQNIPENIINEYKPVYDQLILDMITEISDILTVIESSIPTVEFISSIKIELIISQENNDLFNQVVKQIAQGIRDIDLIMSNLVYTDINDIYDELDKEFDDSLKNFTDVLNSAEEEIIKILNVYKASLINAFIEIKNEKEEEQKSGIDSLKDSALTDILGIIQNTYSSINDSINNYVNSKIDEKINFFNRMFQNIKNEMDTIVNECLNEEIKTIYEELRQRGESIINEIMKIVLRPIPLKI